MLDNFDNLPKDTLWRSTPTLTDSELERAVSGACDAIAAALRLLDTPPEGPAHAAMIQTEAAELLRDGQQYAQLASAELWWRATTAGAAALAEKSTKPDKE